MRWILITNNYNKFANQKLTSMSNNMNFNSSTVSVIYDETEVLIIGFLEDDSYYNQVNIQYQDDFDEQDLSLNWTKYYLEISYKGADCRGAYNCIAKINLTSKSIEIILNDYGKEQLRITDILITFLLDDIKYKNLVNSIETVFKCEKEIEFNVVEIN